LGLLGLKAKKTRVKAIPVAIGINAHDVAAFFCNPWNSKEKGSERESRKRKSEESERGKMRGKGKDWDQYKRKRQ